MPEESAAKAVVERDVLAASTHVDALVLAAKRKNSINFLWEATQAFLAVSLTAATIIAALGQAAIPDTLTNALFVVLGFYFGRTNHSRPTPSDPRGEA